MTNNQLLIDATLSLHRGEKLLVLAVDDADTTLTRAELDDLITVLHWTVARLQRHWPAPTA